METNTSHDQTRMFDLQPHPRILRMLGEINIQPWQCIAELIDNSIDAFIAAKAEFGTDVSDPHIVVSLPTRNVTHAVVTVKDNGPGMDARTLENAVKAGWTGNDPMAHLGMFGMGFNIATARLGIVTQVWSARQSDVEWYGLEIDFDKLSRQRHFLTPVLTRPKKDLDDHGTEVRIAQLKPNQRKILASSAGRANINRRLQRVYSSMLRPNGVPLTVKVHVNTKWLKGHRHCVWGDPLNSPERTVTHGRFGEIDAFQHVDTPLTDRPFCTKCWTWLANEEDACVTCQKSDTVRIFQRRIHGWIGLQRYLDPNDYGIDFLRHGRKIEIANRALFYWRDDITEELEYPIDDPRNRGRLVGEIHLDHCRVHYTKDRFERSDPAWQEMVRVVRGDGPLRPDKAKGLGYSDNSSPLFLLFQAFRRSKPKKDAGSYARNLVVPNNDLAMEMARRYLAGEAEYQSDRKWWELVQEKDSELLYNKDPRRSTNDPLWPKKDPDDDNSQEPDDSRSTDDSREMPPPPRSRVPSLSREYRHDDTNQRWPVEAFSVHATDPDLGGAIYPWRLRQVSAGVFQFLVQSDHPIFASATMTLLDALLAELSWSALDFLHGRDTTATFGSVLADLRERYAQITKLDPVDLAADAARVLRGFSASLENTLSPEDAKALFDELTPRERETILTRLAQRDGSQAINAIQNGSFLKYARGTTILRFFEEHPKLFFDGQYWDIQYENLDFQNPSVTETAKVELVRRMVALIADAIWLAESNPEDLEEAGRPRLLRAHLALDLLMSDVRDDQADSLWT